MLAKVLADGIARHHDDPALIVGDRICTYADLFRLSHALAGSLSERGIQAGNRIAFLLPNGLEVVLCYYACFILGAIAVPLNIRFPPELIAYVLDHSEARVLISEPQLFAGIAPIRSERRHLETVYMVGGSTVTGGEDFGEGVNLARQKVEYFGDLLRADVAPEIDRRSDPDQPAALFYTSGTTGTPKGVIHTHASLMGAVENQVAEIGITGKDKTLIVLPICYLVAFGSQVLPFHAAGATSVVLPGFEPRQMLAVIHTHRPTKLFGFPKIYHELAEAAEASADDLGCLDFCFSAGEAMAVALQQRFRAAFGVEVTEGCGMTELHIYSMNPPHGAKKVGSIGRSIAGMAMRLVDEQGRPVEGPGVIGEIVVRGTSMTAGYWKNADLTRHKIRDGWFYTGDLARYDDDGDYWFFSRKPEVIRQRGQLVSPLEVEAALYQHPSVKEVDVAGIPDGTGGQRAVAHVVLKGDDPTVDERTLIDFAAAKLPPDKAPQRVIFTDRLPYGLTGKIDRRALTRDS